MEYLENVLQLAVILTALLVSLFRYIGSKNRSWLYAVVFFLGSLLSSYFWTAYLVIMGETPNVSSMLAYFGWNGSFLVLFLLTVRLKSKEERRYFHVLMLVPILLNIWQLTLYLPFGGIVNSIYQVVICTATACSSLQSILWYLKKRKEGASTPVVAVAALLYVTTEFAMWTTSCFNGWIGDLYYPFSFLCSLSCLFLTWALRRRLASEAEGVVILDRRVEQTLKGSYSIVTAFCAMGGILFGIWIRNVLRAAVMGERDASVYDVIPVILFMISMIIVAAAAIVIFIVIFEQKVAENQRLKEERQVAEQSNAAKSEFLAHMSHEIRTPMNAVLGMNEMVLHESMKAKDALPEEREQIRSVFADIMNYAANIDSAGNNLLSIINDILDLSKIEAGKLEIREARYELSSVINDVSNMILFKAQAKNLEFTVEVDDEIPDGLFGDEVRLRQVITNVLNNAVKYTREGKVMLVVKALKTMVYTPGQTIELVIRVRDTGIGIKEEDLGRLFGRFERMDLKQNGTVEGTGLGLAITKQLLEMMNGRIEVKSVYGMGSEFIIHLPQVVENAEPIGNFREKFEKSREMHEEEEPFQAPDARVLIVDDTRMNLIVAAGLLKDTRIQTDLAGSGREALEMATHNSYDLIFLDQRMPEMDGTETLQRLRAREESRGQITPVVCLTADAIAGARARYMEEGFTDYLTKPIDGKALKKMVRDYLPQEKIQVKGKVPVTVMEFAAEDEGVQGEAEKSAETSKERMTDVLRKGGINPDTGRKYALNDDGLYRDLLMEFQKSAPEKLEKLDRFLGDRDGKNYSIIIHSVKSTSRTIGAEELADVAAGLEKAADAGDWVYINKEHMGMICLYEGVVRVVDSALRVGQE
ncbi:MAG: response regulator [Butyrivibrio sp.]|nr:response regulator [Butyrivibrio sp.]